MTYPGAGERDHSDDAPQDRRRFPGTRAEWADGMYRLGCRCVPTPDSRGTPPSSVYSAASSGAGGGGGGFAPPPLATHVSDLDSKFSLISLRLSSQARKVLEDILTLEEKQNTDTNRSESD